MAQQYFLQWTSPVLAFFIFGLFGLTHEARASYWNVVRTVLGWFGCTLASRARVGHTSLGEIEFGARPYDGSGIDSEVEYVRPSYIHQRLV